MKWWRSFSRPEKILAGLFLLTLPFVQPRVDRDGIGYYAYARSPLVDHNLQFHGDWRPPYTPPSVATGYNADIPLATIYTETGHLNNHYTVGPAILWAPFLAVTHGGVLLFRRFGGRVAADGFSRPYLITMGLSTALYGFLGLWLSFRMARKYCGEQAAFWATLGIWFASSLPAYMYAEPAWSHAQSAFVAALFLWYWLHTRGERTWAQWAILGAIGGLMMDVYYVNAILLLFPAFETARCFGRPLAEGKAQEIRGLLTRSIGFAFGLVAGFLPTLISRKIIYGSFFSLGYVERWFWYSPAFFKVLFSGDHGLFIWTPVLIFAVVGLFFLGKHDRSLALYSALALVAYIYTIGSYEKWDGTSSFGNRFFVSLTPIFVMGLSACLAKFARLYEGDRGAYARIAVALSLLALWNIGLIFQWTTLMLPNEGPVRWSDVLYNQVRVAPEEALRALRNHVAGYPAVTRASLGD